MILAEKVAPGIRRTYNSCLLAMELKECWGIKRQEHSIAGLNFNTHTNAHLFRAAQEGIAFSFRYGLDIMKETGIDPQVIRAGEANMFLSKVFRETLSTYYRNCNSSV